MAVEAEDLRERALSNNWYAIDFAMCHLAHCNEYYI